MVKVFIDGSAGTTGLRIKDRLQTRDDVSLIELKEEYRKDISARKDAINDADVVFLCLPDDAAKEAVGLVESDSVKVIDTSTAFRTSDAFVYGFSEIVGADRIRNSRFIANPGCHASGFISLVYPLIKGGILDKSVELSCFSLTGYTGGGKKMIALYEGKERPYSYDSPRQYALGQQHKHLAEMAKMCALDKTPVFCPVVCDFPTGMQVTVPLFKDWVNGDIDAVKKTYKEFYTGNVVKYVDVQEEGFLAANVMSGKDGMRVYVYGNEDRMILCSSFDNLGKGASGSAIQNMNILIGAQEEKGLIL